MEKKILETYETEYLGQKVTVKVGKPKGKRKQANRPRNVSTCPECNSTLLINNVGVWECTGDQVKQWEKQFIKYANLDDEGKVKFLNSVSDTGRFEYLYGRWEYSKELEGQQFDCGYSNRIALPISNAKMRLPDPLFVNFLEKKLGRKLTEEEIYGEHDIWFSKGQYLTKYRKNAKKVKIPVITLPDDV